ncbi:MAG TPA: GxxExxY protein [Tepidisphaeraceae bacterium]|jgi:GxxExxY protein|nr:GxxExxY protein [Tepidisphaeraceae bacterium]
MNFYEFRERGNSGVDEATEELAQSLIGAAIEVHKIVKPGMPENCYKLALSRELTLRGIPHQTEVSVPVIYKGERVGEGFIDILVGGKLIVELKAVESLNEVHRAQVIAYLQATGLQLGLLINFNVLKLTQGLKRVINTYDNLRA